MKRPLLSLVIACAVLVPSSAFAVVYVSKNATGTPVDGSSWDRAFPMIGQGILMSNEVWVAAGTYNERVSLRSGTALYGGFSGTETTRDARNPRTNTTIIDGGAGGTVVTASGLSVGVTIDGFTIRNGSAERGAGVHFVSCHPSVVSNCVITANTATNTGGGVFADSTDTTIVNNRIVGNTSNWEGGGFTSSMGTHLIANNVIAHNHAGFVAALGTRGGTLTVTNNTIVDNSGRGTVDMMGGTITLANNIIAGSTYGVSNENATVTMRNNCFYGNGIDYCNSKGGLLANPIGSEGNIWADPQIVNAAAAEVLLAPASPCRNAGNNADVVSAYPDIQGQTRIQAGIVDIGADESDGTTPVWRVVYVDGSRLDDSGAGTSWATAKKTIAAGMGLVALEGGEVWVKSGSYPTPLTLLKGAQVYGGFAGTETSRAQRNITGNPCILDGAQAGTVVKGDYPVGWFTVLDGFTVRNGKAATGGGISCSSGGPQIRSCLISGNASTGDGGGIYVDGGWPMLIGNTIVNNISGSNGGGVRYFGNTSSLGIVLNNRITGNASVQAGGGVVWNYNAMLIANNVIAHNHGGWVAGVGGWGGTSTIINNTITDNLGRGSIDLMGGTSTVANNIVTGGTYGLFADPGTVTGTYRNNCFYDNSADFANLPSVIGQNGNIAADPLLVNDASGALRLTPGSPCIGAGNSADAITQYGDINGSARVQGGTIDIGADESTGSTPAWAVVFVSGVTGDDAKNGFSWANAKKTLQAGMDLGSQLGGEVWVTAGVYPGPVTVKQGIHVYGGFAGTETARDQRDSGTNKTILDSAQLDRVVNIPWYVGRFTWLDGLTIRNGLKDKGAGIYADGSPLLRNCTIYNNQATGEGGAAYFSSDWPIVRDCLIYANTSGGHGAALRIYSGNLIAVGNRIVGNAAGQAGGAIVWDNGTHIIADNVLAHNHAGWVSAVGGWSGTSTITNNTIVDNNGRGAVDIMGGLSNLANNIIAGNTYGIYIVAGTPLSARNNIFYRNYEDFVNLGNQTGLNGNIASDPMLINAADGYLLLDPASPCINAGSNADILAAYPDVQGQARIQGPRVDIGADESNGSTPAWAVSYVNGASGNDVNSGASWAAAKKSVQAGLDAAAVLGAQLWVTGGTYKEKLTMRPGVQAYGGFAGTETLLTDRLAASPATVLDGELGGTVVNAPWWIGPYGALDTCTIKNGKADKGGGVLSHGGPSLRNCMLTANQATGEGGAVYSDGWPTIQGCTITNNTSVGHGAAVRSVSSTKTWLFSNRISSNTSGQAGGALVWDGGTHVIANNLITHNRAGWVAGVGGWGGSATITNNTFVDNGVRGQVDLMGATAVLYNNIITNGTSVGVFGDGNSAIMYNNDVYGNATNFQGVADPGTARGNISTPPTYTDAASDNFTLAASSPCRNTGLDSVIQPDWTDVTGGSRIRGAHVDMGAYESAGTTGYRWWDVIRALRVAEGAALATSSEMTWLNVATDPGVTMLDVLRIARKVAGTDTNP